MTAGKLGLMEAQTLCAVADFSSQCQRSRGQGHF